MADRPIIDGAGSTKRGGSLDSDSLAGPARLALVGLAKGRLVFATEEAQGAEHRVGRRLA